MLRFAKPRFSELVNNYELPASSVHECRLIDPTHDDAINTCAARMSEALVIANHLVKTRAEISALGRGQGTEKGRGDGAPYLLGKYGYLAFGHLCPHGIARGAQDLGKFIAHHWGARTLGWPAQASPTAAPEGIQGKTGLVLYAKIPGFSGEGHIDLWDGDHPVGHAYWNSQTIWFWEMAG